MSRICHVVRQYRPGVGGLESFVENLALALQALGHECDVLTLDRIFRTGGQQRLPAREALNGLRIRRVPMVGHPRFFSPILLSESLARYDVIHVHGIDGMFERVAREPRRAGQAVIATTHGLFFHTPWMRTAKKVYFNTVTRLAVRRYNALIATSRNDARLLRTLRNDVRLIPNGVSPLSCEASGTHLLSHGRLASHKRLHLLIDALAEPPLGDVHLHIVGPEWDVTRAALQDHARNRGVESRIHVHGAVSYEDLCAIAVRCGVFVSASSYEGFGMALIEAFSAGLSAVVSPNASFSEIMSGAPIGALADFRDPYAAAQRIRDELNAITGARRAAARVFAENYSWARNAARTLEVYEAALLQQRRLAA